MNTRMDKYNVAINDMSRAKRNEQLYNNINDINIDYIDINKDEEIDLNDVNNNPTSREEYMKLKKYHDIIGEEHQENDKEISEENDDEHKVYDINEILKKAKEEKIFVEDDDKKRFINTEYNILTKLDLDNIDEEQEKMKEENLKSLIDTVCSNNMANKIEELKETKPIMNDLMSTNIELDEEISKKILDDTYEEKEEKKNIEDKKQNEDLKEFINKTLIGTDELIKVTDEEEKEFEELHEKDDRFVVLVIIISILIVLMIAGIIIAKKMGAF